MTGLSVKEVEAVLAHELAHIRRHDYFVNLVQSFVEVVYFFHPALWWLSARIRTEREHCCDDLAMAVCDDRLSLAHALVRVAEFRHESSLVVAFAANKPLLLRRVRRVLGVAEPSGRHFASRRLSGYLPMAIVLLSLLVGASVYAFQQGDIKEKKERSSKIRQYSTVKEVAVTAPSVQVTLADTLIEEEVSVVVDEQFETPIVAELDEHVAGYPNDSIQKKIEEYQKKMGALQAQMLPYHLEMQALQQQMQPLHQRIADLHLQMEKEHFTVERFQREEEKLDWKKDQLMETRQELMEKRSSLLRPKNGQTKPNTADLEKQLAEFEAQIKAKEQEITTLNDLIKQNREQAKEAEKPLDNLNAEIEKINREAEVFERKMEEVEKKAQIIGQKMEVVSNDMGMETMNYVNHHSSKSKAPAPPRPVKTPKTPASPPKVKALTPPPAVKTKSPAAPPAPAVPPVPPKKK